MPWTLTTFNVMNLLEPTEAAGPAFVQRKIDALAELIHQCDADVIALQEVGSVGLARALAAALPDRASYAEPIVGSADARGIRCALLTRLPVVEAREHKPSALEFPTFAQGDPAPFGARIPMRRGVVHVVVEAPLVGRVHVFTAHFKSRLGVGLRDAAGAELPAETPRARSEAIVRSVVWRAAEALYLRGLVDEALAGPASGGTVVAGDLNDVPESPVLAALRGDGAGALLDCTEGIAPAERYSVIHDGRGVQLDHVLATADLRARVTGAHFVQAQLRDHGPYVPGVAEAPSIDSDHAPLVVCFG
jgi:endonuclease/exonuclease/phosphatase family metal-dependent hydrolase